MDVLRVRLSDIPHRGKSFVDQGQQRYEEQQRQRSIAKRRAASLGFQLSSVEATP